MATLSTDGKLRNFTVADMQAYIGQGPGPDQPAAVLSSIAPTTIARGAPDTTITLTGTGFVSGAVAKIGTLSLATTFTSATSMTAVIPAASLVGPGTLNVVVKNPSAPVTAAKPFTVT